VRLPNRNWKLASSLLQILRQCKRYPNWKILCKEKSYLNKEKRNNGREIRRNKGNGIFFLNGRKWDQKSAALLMRYFPV
jgi:hypothetical protein